MLISFTIENMFSFRDENTLDMRASAIKAHGYSLINEGKHKLLPVAAIYGANASGKTNFLNTLEDALSCMTGRRITAHPFLLIKSNVLVETPSCKIKFIIQANEESIECVFSFGILMSNFFYEELSCVIPNKKRSSLIYLREWNGEKAKWEITIGKSTFAKQFSNEIEYVNEMEPTQTLLLLTALGKRARFSLFEEILSWAVRGLTHRELVVSKAGKPIFGKNYELVSFMENDANSTSLNSFVHMLNPTIDNVSLLRVENTVSTDKGKQEEKYYPVFNYNLTNEIDKSFNSVITKYESKGVWTALHLFPTLHHVLNNGGLLIVDELENSLHPLLMIKIISLFTSPETNPGHGQLIFTTHNALIMDRKYFRQDEIVFVEKDESGASSIYRLSDIEGVRSDLDFCKNYIMGAFGAVPDLSENNEDETL